MSSANLIDTAPNDQLSVQAANRGGCKLVMLVALDHQDTKCLTLHVKFDLRKLPSTFGVLWNAGGWLVHPADGLTMLTLSSTGSLNYCTRMDTEGFDVESVETDIGEMTPGEHTITVHHNECYATIAVDGEDKAMGTVFLPCALLKHWRFTEVNKPVPAFGHRVEALDIDVKQCIVYAGRVPQHEIDTTDAPIILRQG